MMKQRLSILAILLLEPLAVSQAAEVRDLRCEYLEHPLGVDAAKPRLSWVLDSGRQTAYQVVVNGLWDSGKIASDQSINVAYAGKPLESRQRCEWKVRVWDQDGKVSAWSEPSAWTMGLLKPEDWTARWIIAPVIEIAQEAGTKLVIQKATYRTLDGKVEKDVTDVVKKTVAEGKPLRVDFQILGGDPARGKVKELVDIYPTVKELLNLPRPADAPKLAGLSLVPVLTEGKPISRLYAVSENWSQVAVVTDRYKLGVWIDPTPRYGQRDFRAKFPDRLFDREKDPQELANLAGKPEYAAVEAQLRAYLADWAGRTPDDGKKALSTSPAETRNQNRKSK